MQGAQAKLKVFDLDNKTLSCLVFAKEVHEALWDLETNKALGMDGFPPLFYHQYWSIIGREVVEPV